VAEAIAVIAQIALPAESWPDLLPTLIGMGGQDEVVHRQMSMKIFHAMANRLGGAFALHFAEMQPVLSRGLNDSDVEVQLSALG
jgi:hypothetical protein